MKIIAILLVLLSITATAADRIRHESVGEPDGTKVHKYELRQASDRDTVAVLRVTHTIQGQLYERAEYLFYTPDDPIIGSLIVSHDRHKPEIEWPVGHLRFAYDKEYTGLTTGSKVLKAALGTARSADFFRMRSKNEIIEICLYRAPMEAARRHVRKLPDLDEVSAFRNYTNENLLVRGSTLHISEWRDGRVTINVER